MVVQTSFDAFLTEFGQRLKCSEDFCKEGKQLAHQVFLTLQQQMDPKYSIARVHFGGSFGKKTDVIEPDLDLVVVCNDIEPPLAEVLDEFEDVLTLHKDELLIKPGPFKKTERSLNFTFKNGIEVDLLPATNIEDHDEVISKIRMDPKNAYYYNPSFVDKQVAFLKSQDSFTHTLIRLIKYWFKNLYFEEKVMGGSALIELISVAAAEEEKGYECLSMLRAFATVLDKIIIMGSLKLAFRSVDEEKWERIPVNQLHHINWDLIPTVIGSEEIMMPKCFIVDPANSFQDFLEDKSFAVFESFKRFAQVTRNTLSQLVDRGQVENGFVQKLFRPFPTSLVNLNTLLPPTLVCLSCEYTSSIVCDTKVRNEMIMQDKRKKNAIKAFKVRLLSIANAMIKTNPDKVTTSEVFKAAECHIASSLQTSLTPAQDHHDKMDVTLTIPYSIDDEVYAIRFSMSW